MELTMLTGKQKRALRAEGSLLKPIVQNGKELFFFIDPFRRKKNKCLKILKKSAEGSWIPH